MIVRPYRSETDRDDALRVFREVGWIGDAKHEAAADEVFASGRTLVAELGSSVECMATSTPGTLRHLADGLPLSGITSVTTSRVARKRGLAGALTARVLAEEAREGRAVAVLGVFEQGYYNQLGFGNGSYEHWCTFDPARLLVSQEPRLPIRLGPDDWAEMHENRVRRLAAHGACSLDAPGLTRADVIWSDQGFGLGYRDADGRLTHHLWCSAKEAEHGPYTILWTAYRTKAEFLELFALVKSLGDQVRSIKMSEPPGIQLQDLIEQPYKARQITERSPHEARLTGSPYWQARILDLDACLARTHLESGPLRFNLRLSDPIERFLDADAPWRGIGGEYVVTLGRDSDCEPGVARDLPTLDASINAFTRLWLGVRPASGLAWTDELDGPAELLANLDRVVRLPVPHPDWMF